MENNEKLLLEERIRSSISWELRNEVVDEDENSNIQNYFKDLVNSSLDYTEVRKRYLLYTRIPIIVDSTIKYPKRDKHIVEKLFMILYTTSMREEFESFILEYQELKRKDTYQKCEDSMEKYFYKLFMDIVRPIYNIALDWSKSKVEYDSKPFDELSFEVQTFMEFIEYKTEKLY